MEPSSSQQPVSAHVAVHMLMWQCILQSNGVGWPSPVRNSTGNCSWCEVVLQFSVSTADCGRIVLRILRKLDLLVVTRSFVYTRFSVSLEQTWSCFVPARVSFIKHNRDG